MSLLRSTLFPELGTSLRVPLDGPIPYNWDQRTPLIGRLAAFNIEDDVKKQLDTISGRVSLTEDGGVLRVLYVFVAPVEGLWVDRKNFTIPGLTGISLSEDPGVSLKFHNSKGVIPVPLDDHSYSMVRGLFATAIGEKFHKLRARKDSSVLAMLEQLGEENSKDRDIVSKKL
jgi:hypothetical protein